MAKQLDEKWKTQGLILLLQMIFLKREYKVENIFSK